MQEHKQHLVIVGGGITGLSAAFYARKKAKALGMDLSISVIEQSARLGGKINTLHKEGFVIERGPDSFLSRKMPALELSQDLGIEAELVGLNPKQEARGSFILHRGKLKRMPGGLVLGIPTKLGPFFKTDLISLKGKARASMDLVLPRKQSSEDESLGHFLERRLGKEVLQNVAEPLLAGIYAGNTYHLSLQSTFPQFHQMEQSHRSLILGMMKGGKNEQSSNQLPEYAKKSGFLTYRYGLTTLIDTLYEQMKDDVSFLMSTEVKDVQQNGEGGQTLIIQDAEHGQRKLEADGLILTVPAYVLGKLFADEPLIKKFSQMDFVSVANVVLAYRSKSFGLSGSGFVIPRTEGRFITACTWTSVKWPHTAQQGDLLVRCYVGRSGDQRFASMSDEEIVRQVREEVRSIFQLEGEPLFTEVTRLPHSMPQYPVGHRERMDQARKALEAKMPRAKMTGASFAGVGIPDCIGQGRASAEELVEELRK